MKCTRFGDIACWIGKKCKYVWFNLVHSLHSVKCSVCGITAVSLHKREGHKDTKSLNVESHTTITVHSWLYEFPLDCGLRLLVLT